MQGTSKASDSVGSAIVADRETTAPIAIPKKNRDATNGSRID